MYRKIIHGPNMDFQILSRSDARSMSPSVPYALISIRDVDRFDAHLAPSRYCKGVLRLAFQDADVPIKDMRIFEPKDAKRILKFIAPLIDDIECIVVNCEAGRSRSAGVAAGLSVILNGNGEDTIIYRYYTPNALVRRILIDEYQKQHEGIEQESEESEE